MSRHQTTRIFSPRAVPTLDAETNSATTLDGVRKNDLRAGDWVFVTTKNSTYSIYVLGNDTYRVAGGWVDREGLGPQEIAINGCTWGGSVLHREMLGARGLFLEFANLMLTTRIQSVRIVRREDLPVAG